MRLEARLTWSAVTVDVVIPDEADTEADEDDDMDDEEVLEEEVGEVEEAEEVEVVEIVEELGMVVEVGDPMIVVIVDVDVIKAGVVEGALASDDA